jgi:hypothetical protein
VRYTALIPRIAILAVVVFSVGSVLAMHVPWCPIYLGCMDVNWLGSGMAESFSLHKAGQCLRCIMEKARLAFVARVHQTAQYAATACRCGHMRVLSPYTPLFISCPHEQKLEIGRDSFQIRLRQGGIFRARLCRGPGCSLQDDGEGPLSDTSGGGL